jgi:hypothetical protein
MGTASADSGAKPTARPSTGAVQRPAATPTPTAMPRDGQVHAVPRGAADTGVPPVAGGGDGSGWTAAELAAGALVVGGAGALVVRRRRFAARG